MEKGRRSRRYCGRNVRLRGSDDWHLLQAVVRSTAGSAGERGILLDDGIGPAGGVPSVQTLQTGWIGGRGDAGSKDVPRNRVVGVLAEVERRIAQIV
jgi:hypothetical protein